MTDFYPGQPASDYLAKLNALAAPSSPWAGPIAATTMSAVDARNTQQALTAYLLPSKADGWRGVYRAGFDWWSRNQQWGGPWGGELLDAATGVLHRTEFATGYIETVTDSAIGYNAASTWRGQGFKVPETQTLAAIWLKIYKVGNPTSDLSVYIYTDSAGLPSALHTNGTATAQSGKLHTSDSSGVWYRFVFPTPPTLTGGTQYHVTMKSSGAVDTSNYWRIKQVASAAKYPFGESSVGDGTPAWSASTGSDFNILVELSADAQTLQDAGTFDGKLQFGGAGASGTLTMSRGLANMVPLRELIDPTDFTLYLVGTALTKDATIFDVGYGEDHDRIVLRSNVTTGYAQVDVYESDGTKTTKTATATDLSTGTHSVGIRVRAKNDGADEIVLFVDGTEYESTALTLGFDELFASGKLGTMYLGGGFALAPTWTGNAMTDTAQLPSHANNGSWAWTGTGTEANCMSMQGGKLFQNKNGYASTNTGYYNKASAGFSNTNGWTVEVKARVVSSTNTKGAVACRIVVFDGTKLWTNPISEYFLNAEYAAVAMFPQYDFKTCGHVLYTIGKGSDALVFSNRRLIVDGSAALTSATGSNILYFGDADAGAGENSDAIWSYVKHYTTAWTPPQFTAGSIDEFALWQGDLTALWPLLYNAGTQVSVKRLLGVQRNYLDKSEKIPATEVKGITSNPTTTSTTNVMIGEMEQFVIGDTLDTLFHINFSKSTTGNIWSTVRIDGKATDLGTGTQDGDIQYVAGAYYPVIGNTRLVRKVGLGLHKAEGVVSTAADTIQANARNLIVETKL